ncbi:MAG: hypothetical protein SF069_16235 [Phycisphaerae bacterium]|nr:hypothetical protein [Phycisphaerae bacterium]
MSRWVVGSLAISLVGLCGLGCGEGSGGGLLEELIGDGGGRDLADGGDNGARDDEAGGQVGGIQDGTSNTIGIGEQPSGGGAPPVGGGPAEALADLTRELGDKFITFGSSSFFSSGSITESVQLQTCAFGRFGMLVTRVTSTSFDTFSSEETLLGTWTVKAVRGGFVLELNVDQATDTNDIGVQQRVLTVDSNGNLFLDDERAEVADAAADCAAAQRG